MSHAGRSALRIFINYRREDTADATDRLYEGLAAHFGEGRVFMDIDAIDPGLDFRKAIDDAVDSCDVCLAVIGRRWLTVVDGDGRRRLDQPQDFVRMELEAALHRDVRVVPVLVQDVEEIPAADELPEGLRELAWRNAIKLRRESWAHDLGRLIHALDRMAERDAIPRVREDVQTQSREEPMPSERGTERRGTASPPSAREADQGSRSVPFPARAARPNLAVRLSRRQAATIGGVVALVAVVVVAVVALGSGGSDRSSPSGVVADAISGLAAGNYQAVCNDMTATAKQRAIDAFLRNTDAANGGLSCARALALKFSYPDAAGNRGVIRRLARDLKIAVPPTSAQTLTTAITVTASAARAAGAPVDGRHLRATIPVARRDSASPWLISADLPRQDLLVLDWIGDCAVDSRCKAEGRW